MIGVHLEHDRTFGLEVVSLGECVVSLFQQFGDIGSENGHVLFMQLYFEMWRVELHEVLKAVEQIKSVVVPFIKWIALKSLFEYLAAFAVFASAHEVDAQDAHGIPVGRID